MGTSTPNSVPAFGPVAMTRVSRLRRHGIEAPNDPDLGRPSH